MLTERSIFEQVSSLKKPEQKRALSSREEEKNARNCKEIKTLKALSYENKTILQ